MTSCVRCQREYAEADLVPTSQGPLCAACNTGTMPIPLFAWSTPAVALFFALMPFFVSLAYTPMSGLSGHIVGSASRDYVAVGGGGLALVIGAFGVIAAYKCRSPRRIPGFVLCLAAVLLGVYQIARGVGMV